MFFTSISGWFSKYCLTISTNFTASSIVSSDDRLIKFSKHNAAPHTKKNRLSHYTTFLHDALLRLHAEEMPLGGVHQQCFLLAWLGLGVGFQPGDEGGAAGGQGE